MNGVTRVSSLDVPKRQINVDETVVISWLFSHWSLKIDQDNQRYTWLPTYDLGSPLIDIHEDDLNKTRKATRWLSSARRSQINRWVQGFIRSFHSIWQHIHLN